jgi:predicted MFS family arabinose efflux permease
MRRSGLLPGALVIITLVIAVVGSVGAPLITQVAADYDVPLATAQWTLTVTLLVGAITTPILGRVCSGSLRRPAIVGVLAIVLGGSVLTVVPLGLPGLLAGRAAQGLGLGLTAPLIAVARDALPPARARTTIAQISIAATLGIGGAYPVAGWLTDVGGVRLAYLTATSAVAIALVVALTVLPQSSQATPASLDATGAVLLGAGLAMLLIAVSATGLWRHSPALAISGIGLGVGLLVMWAWHERRCADPLVDLRTIRAPGLIPANLTTFVAGIGAYGLQTLITRYVQTPDSAGYGVNGTTLMAGLILVPFAVSGVAGGWLAHRRAQATTFGRLLAAGATVMLLAFVLFATHHTTLSGALVAITVLGAGVGAFNSIMPASVLRVAQPADTASMMSVNQLVRTLGFACGSALAGLVLATMTPSGAAFPVESAYTVAAWCGAAAMVITTMLCRRLGR